MIHAVAFFNLTRRTGQFRSVIPAPSATTVPAPNRDAIELGTGEGLSLQVADPSGHTLWQAPAPFYPSTRSDESEDRTGLVDAQIPDLPGASSLELLDGDRVVATYTVGAPPAVVNNIRAEPPSSPTSRNPVIAWDRPSPAGVPRGVEMDATPPPVYSVQLSADGGSTWQTIGLGLKRPSVTVDRNLLQGRDEVKVRVTSTDGFHAVAREATIQVRDLFDRNRA